VRVSISWDALSRVRTDLGRGGKGYNEEAVVTKLLAQWGCEKLTELVQGGGDIPSPGLVFEAADWPAGADARDLLARSGLL